jgi:hypothetical protein
MMRRCGNDRLIWINTGCGKPPKRLSKGRPDPLDRSQTREIAERIAVRITELRRGEYRLPAAVWSA